MFVYNFIVIENIIFGNELKKKGKIVVEEVVKEI